MDIHKDMNYSKCIEDYHFHQNNDNNYNFQYNN